MPRKRLLGCSYPLAFVVIAVLVGLLVVGFLNGALGQVLTGQSSLHDVIATQKPRLELPGAALFHIGPMPITNTLITSWISMLVLILLFRFAAPRLKIIPGKLQNLLEFVIEWILNFCVEVAGETTGRRLFPVITTIFLFVLMNAWIGLIPGFNSFTITKSTEILQGTGVSPGTARGTVEIITDIGDYTKAQGNEIVVVTSDELAREIVNDHPAGVIIQAGDVTGSVAGLYRAQNIPCITSVPDATSILTNEQTVRIDGTSGKINNLNVIPVFRGANTDVNFPLALALISFVFVLYHGFRVRKLEFFQTWFNFSRLIRGHKKLFSRKIAAGFGDILMGSIDAFVGLIELLSYLFRNISFTFRLFGNMTGGEVLILMVIFLIPWIMAIPFYGLELLVGTIQALVFAGLTLVFANVAINPHETE